MKDAEAELIRPTVEGVKRVLASCAKAGTVTRVVLVSCLGALHEEPLETVVYSEVNFNLSSTPARNPYYYAKRACEEAAAEATAKLHGGKFSLTTVVCGIPLGPLLSPRIPPSQLVLIELMGGERTTIPHMGFGFVDVRDIAQACDLVSRSPAAQGERYIVTNSSNW